jgi:hypothetical protein
MAALFDTENELMSFLRSGVPVQSAAPATLRITGVHFDFLSFLGIAQSLKVDFLPITWQPALDTIGYGGTAKIRQTLVNIQMSFAFKRLILTENFQALVAEISVLGQP